MTILCLKRIPYRYFPPALVSLYGMLNARKDRERKCGYLCMDKGRDYGTASLPPFDSPPASLIRRCTRTVLHPALDLYCTLLFSFIRRGEGKQQQKSRSNCSCAALLFAQRVDGRDGRRLHPRRLFFVFVFHSGVQRKRNKGEGENPQSKQFSAALGTPEE